MLLLRLLAFFTLLLTCPLQANNTPITSRHSIHLSGEKIDYVSTAGFIPLLNDEGKPQASIFYVSYHKIDDKASKPRPVTFCFNGGPGSSSVWLHLGAFGPKRVELPYLQPMVPPFNLTDNAYSLLDVTDLVFVDPVSTGYSRPAAGVEAKTFYNSKEDIRSLSEFIRIYITQYNLWDAPKFLIGESYGGFRAAAMAAYMHDHQYIYLNGIVMISPALNFETLWDFDNGNDLPYPLRLPTYAAAAAFHLNKSSLEEATQNAEKFALGTYPQVLFKGDALTQEEKEKAANELSQLTGLSKDYIQRANLRIDTLDFNQQLLKNKNLTLGYFDSRYTQPSIDEVKPILDCVDPSADAFLGPFTAAINTYLLNDLDWKSNQEYIIFADTCPWDFNANNQYPSVQEKLRNVMTKNPHLRVFATAGYYDMATPYYSILYSLSHLNLDPSLQSHLTKKIYPTGHMPYLETPILKQLKNDIAQFYKETLKE